MGTAAGARTAEFGLTWSFKPRIIPMAIEDAPKMRKQPRIVFIARREWTRPVMSKRPMLAIAMTEIDVATVPVSVSANHPNAAAKTF